MDSIDAKVFAAITGLTLVLVEVLKAFFPKAIDGKEAKIAAVLPIFFVIGAKAGGLFSATPWVDAVLWAISGGAASGVGHDKVWDPIKGLVKGFFTPVTPSDPPPPKADPGVVQTPSNDPGSKS